MRILMKTLAAFMATSVFFGLAAAASAKDKEPLPIDYWAIRDTVKNVEVSPDGKHVLLLRIESKEGNPFIVIYNTQDLMNPAQKPKPFRRLNANPMEFISAQWVSNDKIVGIAWQVVRHQVKGPEQDVRNYKVYAYDINANKFSQMNGNFGIVSLLPNDPDHILVESTTANIPGMGQDDPFANFRPRSYYKFNLKDGTRSLVLKGSDKYPSASFDINGNPRFRQTVDRADNAIVSQYRRAGDNEWHEFDRLSGSDHDIFVRAFNYVGDRNGDPDTGLVLSNLTDDKVGLYEFNFKTGKLGKLIYHNPDADILGIQRNSNFWSGDRKLVAAIYPGATYERHWFDAQAEDLHKQLEAVIPNSHYVRISSRSRDGSTMIVQNTGPKDPGSFWLVKDGKILKLGSQNPLLKAEDLADVKFVKFKARDGLMIPAYITIPHGKGPFPAIVLPHGGPYVNEVVNYDEWSQMLANNGYVVIQPEYRGSTGWGKQFFLDSWQQHGYKMQDDLDDAAEYLVKQGLADSKNMAMFGWSYGGYAALVASERSPNIYQCVVAGAAVADPLKVYLKRKDDTFPAADAWSRQRGAFSGINPLKDADKVDVPILMVHGNYDRRVLYFNYTEFKRALEKAGKTGNEFLTLKGADHFYVTLYYKHQKKLYDTMLDFLGNKCGPGGLKH